ncbi:MAG TPA: NAD(P)H-binding protein [Phnomibacter sp.]|nr:NAD(P)H-binding protein [Phnomibacter sp.]
MTVTIFGATGTVGKQLITICLAKGWRVKAFGRNMENLLDKDLRTENFEAIKGYVFDEKEVRHAIEDSDGVLSVLGGAFDGTDKARSLGIKNIIGQMEATHVKRIVALGGKGCLQNEDGEYLMDAKDYPEEYKPVGNEHRQAYLYLKASSTDWTFVCSPDILPKDADNHFTTLSEKPAPGNQINAGNLALFMAEELEQQKFIKQRVGISNL